MHQRLIELGPAATEINPIVALAILLIALLLQGAV